MTKIYESDRKKTGRFVTANIMHPEKNQKSK